MICQETSDEFEGDHAFSQNKGRAHSCVKKQTANSCFLGLEIDNPSSITPLFLMCLKNMFLDNFFLRTAELKKGKLSKIGGSFFRSTQYFLSLLHLPL